MAGVEELHLQPLALVAQAEAAERFLTQVALVALVY